MCPTLVHETMGCIRLRLRMRRSNRLFEIQRRFSSGRHFNALSLARDLGASERTIRRDLQSLREQVGDAITYDAVNHTWRATGPLTGLPATVVSSEDRFALLVARQAVEQYRSTPWFDRLKAAFDRMIESLPPERKTAFATVAAKIRFEGRPVPEIPATLWQTLCTALEVNETVAIEYKTGRDGTKRNREVDPYGLIVRNREWYLVGWDHLRRCIRTFFLPRIRAADYADRRFTVREGFQLDRYLETSIDGHQSSLPPTRVRLRYSVEASSAGEAYIWNSTQKISRDKSGRVVVEFVTAATFAVERQVLSWCGRVEVLTPRAMRRKVAQVAESVLSLHRNRKS